MKFPIGVNLTVKQDYELIGLSDNEKPIQVKKGDRILVTQSGFEYLTGAARGRKSLANNLIDQNKYDTDNIALRITDTIIDFLGENFKEFMDFHEIEKKELFDEILNELDYFI